MSFASSNSNMSKRSITDFLCALAVIVAVVAPTVRASATDLLCSFFELNYTGTAVDNTIPLTGAPQTYTFQIKGGDGGWARIERCTQTGCSICEAEGGKAAEAVATFVVGNGPGQLAPGGTLRFIVGGRGTDGYGLTFVNIGTQSGGGGGGTAILYRPPNLAGESCASDWQVLMAAGGGGGAYQGAAPIAGCVNSNNGKSGRIDSNGSGGDGGGGGNAGDGGTFGQGGGCGDSTIGLLSGGGGGYLSGGGCGMGGGAGCPSGGDGGQTGGSPGGWGFGGGGGAQAGGGGGGGGGYSGGGGGGNARAGGGGGSYIASFAYSPNIFVSNNPNPDGFVFFQCGCAVGDPPVNDECAGALPLTPGIVTGCTDQATNSSEAPLSCSTGNPLVKDIWYYYTNNDICAQQVDLAWCDNDFKELVGFYFECGGAEAACADFLTSCSATITLAAGDTVYLRIGGFLPEDHGEVNIAVSVERFGDNADGDGKPDSCDPCPNDSPDDSDLDGVCDSLDPCPFSSLDECVVDATGFDCPYNIEEWIESGIPDGFTFIDPASGEPSSAEFNYSVGGVIGPVSDRGAVFEITPATSGTWSFDYTYIGNHANVGAVAQFYVAVIGPGSQTNYLVVDQTPSGPFSYNGTVSVPVNGGFPVALVMAGRNDDITGIFTGALTVSNVTWPQLPDDDADGVADSCDVCPGGDDLADGDGDGLADFCDSCPNGDNALDADGDSVPDGCDVCPGFNDTQDADGDGIPNGCDPCPNSVGDDSDGDGVCDAGDRCPGFDDNIDTDIDGVPDGCDACVPSPGGLPVDASGCVIPAQWTFRAIASDGDAFDAADGVDLSFFQTPALNNLGTVAVAARLQGNVTDANDSAVLLFDAQGLSVIAREGQPALGAGGALYGELNDFPPQLNNSVPTSPDINEYDEVAFLTRLTGVDITSANDRAIVLASQGVVAREGGSAPGVPGTILSIDDFIDIEEDEFPGLNGDDGVSLNNAGEVAFNAHVSGVGYAILTQDDILARPSDPEYGPSKDPEINNAGQLLVKSFPGATGMPIPSNCFGDNCDELTLDGVLFGKNETEVPFHEFVNIRFYRDTVSVNQFWDYSLNDRGEFAYIADTITVTFNVPPIPQGPQLPPGIRSAYVFRVADNKTTTIATDNDVTPLGPGSRYTDFMEVATNDAGEVLVLAAFQGPTNDAPIVLADPRGLFFTDTGGNTSLIVRTAYPIEIDGIGEEVVVDFSFREEGFNDAGDVAFRAVTVNLQTFTFHQRLIVAKSGLAVRDALPPAAEPDGNECEAARTAMIGVNTGTLSDNNGTTSEDDDCGTLNNFDEWFSYTATINGTATISTCNPATGFDTVLSLFDDCPFNGGVQLACNDDGADTVTCDLFGETALSTIQYDVTAGQTYLIRLSVNFDEPNEPSGPDFELTIEESDAACTLGDVDDSGSVTIDDLAPFIAVVLNPAAATEDQQCAADVNEDANIDGRDLQSFLNLLLAP